MYAGIDIGTTYTKTHTGLIFPSGTSDKFFELSSNVMTVCNKTYAMELLNEKSEYGINVNKGLNLNTKLNYLYALHKIANKTDIIYKNVIVGLPAGQWTNNEVVQQYKNLLNLQQPLKVTVNGLSRNIQVDNIDIVPEGATAYYMLNYEQFEKRKTLLIDWGGLTINQILFQNDEIVDVATEEDGVLKIYQEMASAINNKLGTNIKIEDMYEILTKGYFYKGKHYDIRQYIDKIAFNYCDRIYKKIKLRWGVDSIKHVPLVGAGSIVMIDYIKAYIPQSTLQKDAQLLAAKGMEYIARCCA